MTSASYDDLRGEVSAEQGDEPEPSVLIEDDMSDFDDEDISYLQQALEEEAAEGDEDGDDVVVEEEVINIGDLPSVGEPLLHSRQAEVPAAYANDRMIVVVDTDGVQELPFTFCQCFGAPRQDLQILDLGLYPASSLHPRTVFTSRLLDDFLLSNKECNASARNYYNALRRRTNNAFPHMVPDRY
ncbi:hypothetical protein K466DRAFT_606245 [Polyporus arcularius HHB13444]|uniref:CxC2-like cysteine cluster KDZ transposase-associated domain-containing protein n=1 Tax=Polyporus arcularius HHB13444 TaxID=1314778 RepID=A0A5C3NQI9_9APHY|nr:hypothetical protein K466DRAFT_606245 [Polyporus arcularius HHB13444]